MTRRAKVVLLFPGCPLVYLGLLVVGELAFPAPLRLSESGLNELADLTAGKSLSNVVVEFFAAIVLGAAGAAMIRVASPPSGVATLTVIACYTSLALLYFLAPLIPE